MNFSVVHWNDGIHNTVLNVTAKIFQQIENMFCLVELRLPEGSSDQNFQRSFFKTSLDVNKVIKGVRGNQLISFIYDKISESVDFEMKFPLKPVSVYQFQVQLFDA